MTKIHFRPYNSNQTVLFPQRIDEDIAEHDPVRMVDALVESLNLESFRKLYKECGRSPYHPRMMLKVILYAYMNNIYSCRKIEKLLHRDIHYIWLAGYLTGKSHLLVRYAADACDSGAAARHEKGGGSMTYIENIFLCMVSPLLVAALCMGRRQLRFFLFCIAGMGVCLLSAYINTFLAAVCRADALAATAEIAPVVEEMMKLLPLVFYLLVFEPEGDKIKAAAITVTLAFATFENVCYLIQNGADRFSFIFFRGFGTGAMHVLCGIIVGGGLAYTWHRTWLKIAGTCGLLGAAITLHAIYNLLIAHGGAAQYIAYALPVLLVAAGKLSAFRLGQRK